MTQRISTNEPLQNAPLEYTQMNEQQFRAQVERQFALVRSNMERNAALEIDTATQALKKYQFLSGARGEH